MKTQDAFKEWISGLSLPSFILVIEALAEELDARRLDDQAAIVGEAVHELRDLWNGGG